MIYHVRARFKEHTAAAFLAKLTDGTISRQRPDGSEIVASMARAVLTPSGLVEWSEICFCPTPLLHERATVLDQHFDDLETDPIDAHTTYDGRPFMEYLNELAAGSAN